MGLFKKKKEKYHTLDRGLLAEAISIYLGSILFDNRQTVKHIHKIIQLNDVLKIEISCIGYWHSSYSHSYSMNVHTYVENIPMADYRFRLDISENKEIYRRWKCSELKIMHYMPNQFIDLMNSWSRKIVSEFDEKRNNANKQKELSKRMKYDEEESILNKYR